MLKASDLRQVQKKRTDNTKTIFKKLLDECNNKLHNRNALGLTNMIFTINHIKIGYPVFDVSAALHYISKKLMKGGFKVFQTSHNTIFIDWSRQYTKNN